MSRIRLHLKGTTVIPLLTTRAGGRRGYRSEGEEDEEVPEKEGKENPHILLMKHWRY